MNEPAAAPLFSPRERRILLWLCVGAVCWRWLLAIRAPLPAPSACLDLWVARQLVGGQFAALAEVWWRPWWALLLAPPLAAGAAPFLAAQVLGCLVGGLAIWPMAVAAERLRRGAGVPAAVIALAAGLPAAGAANGSALPLGTFVVAMAAACMARGRWLGAGAFVLAAVGLTIDREPGGAANAWLDVWRHLRDGWSLAVPFALLALLSPRPPRAALLWGGALVAFAVGWPTGRLSAVLPLWAPCVGVLAAVGVARWPVRLGELALGGFVVIGFLAAWQRTEPRVAIAERLLGTHLAHRSGPDAAIVADLPRLLFFAGQRPVAPIDRDALLHVASAPGVAFVVLSATAADATVTSALSSRFGRYQMPADLRDLAADRELLVFVRRE